MTHLKKGSIEFRLALVEAKCQVLLSLVSVLSGVLFSTVPGVAQGADQPARKPKTPKKACRVPGCKRPSKVHGLCASHYGKTKRLGMNPSFLDQAQLKELGVDGRSTRFQPKKPLKLVRGKR